MSTRTEREAIKLYYGRNSPFAKRVDKMSDSQVIAIYLRLKAKGVIR